jgi:thiosulfate/3-mercaptopyruvate sulfurtransferase
LAELVDFSWIDQNKDDPGLVVVDSRPPVKYLQGHIPRAVNISTSRVFDKGTLELLPLEELARLFGNSGIDEERTVVVYDDHDGQNEAMLAWTLELLGHPRVKLLSRFMARWTKESRPISYRPASPEQRMMRGSLALSVRATPGNIVRETGVKLIDMRSPEEFEGKSPEGSQSKHLDGAASLPWTTLLGEEDEMFGARPRLETLVSQLGLVREDQIVTYCSYGPRAALGYAALQQLGFKHVKVYDKAFQHWTKRTGLSLDPCTSLI